MASRAVAVLSLASPAPLRSLGLSLPSWHGGGVVVVGPAVFGGVGWVVGHGRSGGVVMVGGGGLGGKNDVTWHRCDMLSRGSGIADTCVRCQMWQLL